MPQGAGSNIGSGRRTIHMFDEEQCVRKWNKCGEQVRQQVRQQAAVERQRHGRVCSLKVPARRVTSGNFMLVKGQCSAENLGPSSPNL